MILNQTEYNPFPEIQKIVKGSEGKVFSLADLDLIRKELFKGGVIPETDEEFNTSLKLLSEMDII